MRQADVWISRLEGAKWSQEMKHAGLARKREGPGVQERRKEESRRAALSLSRDPGAPPLKPCSPDGWKWKAK